MISGKSFSERCKWVIDPRYPERQRFQYSTAKNGDWVFVNGDFLQTFVQQNPFLVTKKYIVVVHNSDRPFTEVELKLLLPLSYHIYAINTTVRHPLLTTIPLGFVDKQLPFIEGFKGGSSERDIEIYMNFTPGTNVGKRKECMDSFQTDSRVTIRSNLSVAEYYIDLCRSKFVLCPEGTGIDTHRVYEALFCGATPVVLRNSLSHLYEKLPVCIIEKWTDEFKVPEQRNIDFNVNVFL